MKHEERLAIIYEPISYKKGALLPTSIALINYNKTLSSFIVKEGEYKGFTQSNFNLIRGHINFMYGRENKIYINRSMSKDQFIYIFDNRDIKNVKETLEVNLFETYLYIAEHAFNTTLVPYEIGIFTNTYRSMIAPLEIRQINSLLYNKANIYQQLYGEIMPEEEKKEKEEEKKEIIVYKLDANTNELREANANDLLEKLPNSLKSEKFKTEDINIMSVINEINNKIVGQEEAITTLVTNIYYNQKLIDVLSKEDSIDETELDSRKVNILMDGATGTGKTAIAKLIASKFELPIVIANANSFSETGYVGPTITDMLKKLIKQANGDVKKAERGIIVLDEIDKIAVEKEHGHNMKKGVQEELLSFIGGGKYDIKMHDQFGHNLTFDTSKITFILMGAFTDIRESKIKENSTNKIGFGDTENRLNEYSITPQDYIDYGLMREFFGRIKVLVSTKSYSKEDLMRILLSSEISPLKNFEKNAKMFGYDGITYEEEFINKVIEEAYEMKTGARALQTIMSGIQNELLLEMVTNNIEDENKKIELDYKLLDSYKKAKVIKY